MEVIFVKDLRGQGKKGDIKEVKQGYGENFLIKNGYAVLKTKENLKKLEKDQANKAKELELEKEKATKLKEQIEKLTIDFKVNVGEGDKVFGSISSKQIKDALLKKDTFETYYDYTIITPGMQGCVPCISGEEC